MAGEVFAFIGFVWILLAIGTARDAKQKGGNPEVWFIVVAFTGIFGLFAYSIAHMNHSQNTEADAPKDDSGTVIKDLLIGNLLCPHPFLPVTVSLLVGI